MTDHAQRARELTKKIYDEASDCKTGTDLVDMMAEVIAAALGQAAQEAITGYKAELEAARAALLREGIELGGLQAQLQAAQPVWSGDKPTKAGWYWWRMTLPGAQRFMLCLSPHPHADRVGLWVSGIHLQGLSNLDDWGGEWAGPLMEPMEA